MGKLIAQRAFSDARFGFHTHQNSPFPVTSQDVFSSLLSASLLHRGKRHRKQDLVLLRYKRFHAPGRPESLIHRLFTFIHHRSHTEEAVNHSIVAGCRGLDAGLLEPLGVGLTFIPKGIVLSGNQAVDEASAALRSLTIPVVRKSGKRNIDSALVCR